MAGLRDLVVAGKVIPQDRLSVKFSRSGGPGGQNVNKVSSKADVRLDLDALVEILGVDAVGRIREKLASRLDRRGHLQVVSSEHRDQIRNVETAVDLIETLLAQSLVRPKVRRKTKPTAGSQQRRLDAKKRRGKQKKLRSDVDD